MLRLKCKYQYHWCNIHHTKLISLNTAWDNLNHSLIKCFQDIPQINWNVCFLWFNFTYYLNLQNALTQISWKVHTASISLFQKIQITFQINVLNTNSREYRNQKLEILRPYLLFLEYGNFDPFNWYLHINLPLFNVSIFILILKINKEKP